MISESGSSTKIIAAGVINSDLRVFPMLVYFACCFLFIGIHDASATIDVEEPFVAVSCFDKNIHVANLDSLNFTSVAVPFGEMALDSVWDSVEKKLYMAIATSPKNRIVKMSIDGSDVEVIMDDLVGSSPGLHIDEASRKLFYISNRIVDSDGSFVLMADLDGSNREQILDRGVGNARDMINGIPGRVYVSGKGHPSSDILTFDGEGNQCVNETYVDPLDTNPNMTGTPVASADFTEGKLYWIGIESPEYPVVLRQRDIADTNDGSSVEVVYNTTSNLATYDMQMYQDYAYMAHVAPFGGNSTGLLRIRKDGSDAESISMGADQLCVGLEIYAPPPLLYQNETDVEMVLDKAWYGGFIADLVLPFDPTIDGTVKSWTLKITFPRQVYNVKLEGCDAVVQAKEQVSYKGRPGKTKGTAYTLRSGPNYRAPQGDEEQHVKFIGKTWRSQRGFKNSDERPVVATFSAQFWVTPFGSCAAPEA